MYCFNILFSICTPNINKWALGSDCMNLFKNLTASDFCIKSIIHKQLQINIFIAQTLILISQGTEGKLHASFIETEKHNSSNTDIKLSKLSIIGVNKKYYFFKKNIGTLLEV